MYNLINGNSLEIIKTIDKKFDFIFIDPPYFLSNNGFTCKNGKQVNVNKGNWDKSNGFEDDTKFHNEYIKGCKNLLKDNGSLMISGTYHNIYTCGYLLLRNEYHIINDITWFKPNASPNLSCRCFTASHETILWAKKEKTSKHIFNYKELKSGVYPKDILKKKNKQMRSVWSIPTTAKKEKLLGKHPTQKPLNLMERIIIATTNENSEVLDLFCGSGSLGVVCNKLNRNYTGIDKNQEYIDLTKKRIEEYNNINLFF